MTVKMGNVIVKKMNLNYFKYEEFDSPDLPNSGMHNMDAEFLGMLESARRMANIPFKINSGYRTEQHNLKVGGKPKTSTSQGSAHLYGKAVDIACTDSRSRWIIVDALIRSGFNRIGIAKTFIHTDSMRGKDDRVIWMY